MRERHKLEADFEGLRLVVASDTVHWQVFVYDVENCEVLHACQRISIHAAKHAAVEFAAAYRFGPRNDLEPDAISTRLAWETV
ncbi:MAG TPA: hypothetical protein VN736_22940 [Candidatus Limnocylindrales bacterium]|nr:hypothetical protein [Candidatus Limnocylindrales bacterium]